ncbi:hypothetical protein JJQ72_19100, partial [Paenibacillus sp. F411]|uniref:hypothetical protein n=1 Tax=Paenibacillus sp. F411 TaxID=2820239 RepID=UPI001AAE64BF
MKTKVDSGTKSFHPFYLNGFAVDDEGAEGRGRLEKRSARLCPRISSAKRYEQEIWGQQRSEAPSSCSD